MANQTQTTPVTTAFPAKGNNAHPNSAEKTPAVGMLTALQKSYHSFKCIDRK